MKMVKIGMLVMVMLLASGCASFVGEDPQMLQAKQKAEQAQYMKHDRLQSEAESLRSEIKAKKIELQSL